ncbi:MAG: hypothetical protein ACPGJS_07810 [Flammeovirgaceae bacterium]
MNRSVATAISYLTHPGFVPVILFAILMFMGKGMFPDKLEYQLTMLGFIFNFTFLLPFLIIYFLYTRRAISSLKIPNREERIVPFGIITICYTVLVFLFNYKLPSLYLFTQIMATIAITQALCTIITTKFKISIHATALSGMLGVLMALELSLTELDLFFPILITIIAGGLSMSARLALNAHTPQQVLYGFLLGFGLNFAFISFLN